ncbi:hypothetical protein BJX65DRAFT_287907 [Aspergillus insuetus]
MLEIDQAAVWGPIDWRFLMSIRYRLPHASDKPETREKRHAQHISRHDSSRSNPVDTSERHKGDEASRTSSR